MESINTSFTGAKEAPRLLWGKRTPVKEIKHVPISEYEAPPFSIKGGSGYFLYDPKNASPLSGNSPKLRYLRSGRTWEGDNEPPRR